MTTQLTAGQKAARTRKLRLAAVKSWETRRRNSVNNTVKTVSRTQVVPNVLTTAEARAMHAQANKLTHKNAVQVIHTMIDLMRGKSIR